MLNVFYEITIMSALSGDIKN